MAVEAGMQGVVLRCVTLHERCWYAWLTFPCFCSQ